MMLAATPDCPLDGRDDKSVPILSGPYSVLSRILRQRTDENRGNFSTNTQNKEFIRNLAYQFGVFTLFEMNNEGVNIMCPV
jgi:hypothetical protein